MVTKRIRLKANRLSLFGEQDRHLKMIEEAFQAKITARGEIVTIQGEVEEVNRVSDLLARLSNQVKRDGSLSEEEVFYMLRALKKGEGNQEEGLIRLHTPKLTIRPKSEGQREYLEAMNRHDIVVSIGPAGTGKTYLAVAKGVDLLHSKQVERILLVRPAVEAGESLGFLPGDYQEKVDPYLRPLYDALYEMLPYDRMRRWLDSRTIEVAPLAYMRGRTLNDAFIILDEAQNTTRMQMKMFLTRLGIYSKAVITGDITQIDLPQENASGLVEIKQILNKVEGIQFIYLAGKDVVRHRLVTEIIKAYERKEQDNEDRDEEG
ncbi:PhoH family protein [candidate division TA06 bacterium]|nr:PhoH family protein [candidate division TA06 bacterium]